jgi:hypothetical protein
MLGSVDWSVVTDVSGQNIASILKDQGPCERRLILEWLCNYHYFSSNVVTGLNRPIPVYLHIAIFTLT